MAEEMRKEEKELLKNEERTMETVEKIEWLELLLSYAEGKKWDTGGVWGCSRR